MIQESVKQMSLVCEPHTAIEMEGLKPLIFSVVMSENQDEHYDEEKKEDDAGMAGPEQNVKPEPAPEPEPEAEPKRDLASLLMRSLLHTMKAEATVSVLIGIDFEKDAYLAAREEFSTSDGCKNIIEAMHNVSESPSLQWKCCKLIMNLTRNYPKNKTAFLKADAVDAIAGAMQTFPEDENLQSYGCGAIRNLSTQNPEKVVEDGGLEAVLCAMKEHPQCEELQSSACICLYNLTIYQKGKLIEKIIDLGGGARLADAHYLYKGRKECKIEEFARHTIKMLYSIEDSSQNY